MAASELEDAQLAMARYLRDPDSQEPPEGIEPRRLKIYEGLVYNNIESFLTSGFPVLHSLYGVSDWRALVRAFMQDHRCHSPYFLEISQEFLQFLMHDHAPRESDPPFMAQLAHYEWVELALDVSQDILPASDAVADIANASPRLSPLAWPLAYNYPVHRVGPRQQSVEEEATYLVVYRNREDHVKFVEVNAATARLLELIGANENTSAEQLLQGLAEELGVTGESIRAFGLEQIEQFALDGILWLKEVA